MDRNAIKAFIFDMDDTIFNSERLNIELINRYFLETFDLKLDDEDDEYVFGHAWQDIYIFVSNKYGLKSDYLSIRDGVLKLKREYLAGHKLELGRGVPETLGIPVRKAIVSGSADIEIEMMLESAGIAGSFEFCIATEYGKGKPKPDGFNEALERMKLRPSEALVFEDSFSGIASAKSAGIPVVFIRQFAFHDHSGKADYAFGDFAEFNKFFLSK
jgi:beta-phosphoglucomutase